MYNLPQPDHHRMPGCASSSTPTIIVCQDVRPPSPDYHRKSRCASSNSSYHHRRSGWTTSITSYHHRMSRCATSITPLRCHDSSIRHPTYHAFPSTTHKPAAFLSCRLDAAHRRGFHATPIVTDHVLSCRGAEIPSTRQPMMNQDDEGAFHTDEVCVMNQVHYSILLLLAFRRRTPPPPPPSLVLVWCCCDNSDSDYEAAHQDHRCCHRERWHYSVWRHQQPWQHRCGRLGGVNKRQAKLLARGRSDRGGGEYGRGLRGKLCGGRIGSTGTRRKGRMEGPKERWSWCFTDRTCRGAVE